MYSGKAMCDSGHRHSTGSDGNALFETTVSGSCIVIDIDWSLIANILSGVPIL